MSKQTAIIMIVIIALVGLTVAGVYGYQKGWFKSGADVAPTRPTPPPNPPPNLPPVE